MDGDRGAARAAHRRGHVHRRRAVDLGRGLPGAVSQSAGLAGSARRFGRSRIRRGTGHPARSQPLAGSAFQLYLWADGRGHDPAARPPGRHPWHCGAAVGGLDHRRVFHRPAVHRQVRRRPVRQAARHHLLADGHALQRVGAQRVAHRPADGAGHRRPHRPGPCAQRAEHGRRGSDHAGRAGARHARLGHRPGHLAGHAVSDSGRDDRLGRLADSANRPADLGRGQPPRIARLCLAGGALPFAARRRGAHGVHRGVAARRSHGLGRAAASRRGAATRRRELGRLRSRR